MRNASLVFCVGVAAVAMAAPGWAESTQDAAFAALVLGKPAGKGPASVCFARVYDASHLAQHPKQNVRAMTMLLTTRLEDDGNRGYDLRIGVKFRVSGQTFETQGSCGSIHVEGEPASGAAVAHCGVDCDGGAMDVALKNANSTLVTIPEGARLWAAGTEVDLKPSGKRQFGADDKLFRLDRADMSQCLPLIGKSEDRKDLGIGK